MSGSNSRRMPAIILMIAAICVFTSAGALAQGQGQGQGRGGGAQGRGQGRQMMGQAMLDRMHSAVKELNLTDEQKPKIDEIFTKAKDDFSKMQPELQDLPMQERGPRVREFTEKLVGDVKGVLNDEQRAAFEKRVAEFQQQRGGGQGAGQGGQTRRMREAIDALGLTDEQKPKIDAIMKEMEAKVQQAQQESQGDRDAMREKLRVISTDTLLALDQVLTPEQTKQLRESMRNARGSGNGDGQGRERRRGDAPATRPSDGDANPPATQPEKKTADR